MRAVLEIDTHVGKGQIVLRPTPGTDEAQFISDCFGKVGTTVPGFPFAKVVKVLRFIF